MRCPMCNRRHPQDCGQLCYFTAHCPVCLEDVSPFVVIPCGHGLCRPDFEALAGKLKDGQDQVCSRTSTATLRRQQLFFADILALARWCSGKLLLFAIAALLCTVLRRRAAAAYPSAAVMLDSASSLGMSAVSSIWSTGLGALRRWTPGGLLVHPWLTESWHQFFAGKDAVAGLRQASTLLAWVWSALTMLMDMVVEAVLWVAKRALVAQVAAAASSLALMPKMLAAGDWIAKCIMDVMANHGQGVVAAVFILAVTLQRANQDFQGGALLQNFRRPGLLLVVKAYGVSVLLGVLGHLLLPADSPQLSPA